MKKTHKIENKPELIAAAQTLGADAQADRFWAQVEHEISQLQGEVKPDEIKPRQTRAS